MAIWFVSDYTHHVDTPGKSCGRHVDSGGRSKGALGTVNGLLAWAKLRLHRNGKMNVACSAIPIGAVGCVSANPLAYWHWRVEPMAIKNQV
jgi:hypothetical protein